MDSKILLQNLVNSLTGKPAQSENLKQALRYARGALRSSLASECEILEHVKTLQSLMV